MEGWLRKKAERKPTVLVLADSQLKYWPDNDRVCSVEYHSGWAVCRWSQAIKLGKIRIDTYFTMTLYLQGTQNWHDLPPIKNLLETLCKVIKQHGNNPRIFIADHLPHMISVWPLQRSVESANFTLHQATRSVNRALKGSVFELSVYEHFISAKKQHVLRPLEKYFMDQEQLTVLGCMVFREVLMRESRIKSYFFK